jgi:DNA ligase-1
MSLVIINVNLSNIKKSNIKLTLEEVSPIKLEKPVINRSEIKRYNLVRNEIPNTIPEIMRGEFMVNPSSGKYLIDRARMFDWWVSEKMDGIRAIWNGNILRSRSGKEIRAPKWFLEDFPKNMSLDGELWIARGKFGEVQGTVLSSIRNNEPLDQRWHHIKYYVFDIPDVIGFTFEESQELLSSTINSDVIRVVKQEKFGTYEELLLHQKDIISKGGEGTMLRRVGSVYERSLSKNLLKFKGVFVDNELQQVYDREAVIIGYNYKGNQYKSLRVKWIENEIEFSVTNNIKEEKSRYPELYPVGKIVKILYNELQPSGKPRFPRLMK